uniref:Terpene synthase 3 n=1 Tax=Jasminum sambac TaxID=660624 RepID=A0A8T9EC85_9LAMI|nr:terpene synthase 3 [Jasminum sambac]
MEQKNEIDSIERRNANYKPNIWNYSLLQSLTNNYNEEKYGRQVEILKMEVSCIFEEVKDPLAKLELIDCIGKLALSHYFERDIYKTLNMMVKNSNNFITCMKENLHLTALYFRILRTYGYEISQDVFLCFTNGMGQFTTSPDVGSKHILQLLEASYHGMESEFLLDQAQVFATKNLMITAKNSLICPLHLSVEWFNVKRHIHAHEKENKTKSTLLQLGRLNFNISQAQQQQDLKEILRWWNQLDLSETLTFTRNRVVESFLWSVGVASDTQHASVRKSLTKVIMFVLIIDDVYDIYGSMEELECFTRAVNRWEYAEVEQLPEAIRRCFWALQDTTYDIDLQIQQEKGWPSVLPYLTKRWADFCGALHVEAKWYQTGYTPRLWEYLSNGWISSSGPLLSLVVLLGLPGRDVAETIELLEENQEIIYYASLIIRLCNDQGTSTAELERGDAPSSILCYMREANVTEEEAREHIRKIIGNLWKKINGLCVKGCPNLFQTPIKHIVNTARVANFIYQKGDGFSVPDGDTKNQVLSCLIEPFLLV